MYRGFVCALVAAVALAQDRPQEDPVQAALRACQDAHNLGRFEEAAAQRELARNLLDQIPADAAELGNSARNVAQLYEASGFGLRALAIAQAALARSTSSEARIVLLQGIADFYMQDRNLLQAAAYREKAVAALEEAASKPAVPNKNAQMNRAAIFSGSFSSFVRWGTAAGDRRINAYELLAALYRQLGRPDAAAAIDKRILAITKSPAERAMFFQRQGQMEEAAAIYKKEAEQNDPAIRAGYLQSLGSVYQQEGLYAEAADAFRQAIAAANSSGKAEVQQQTIGDRANLASALGRAGQTEAGDQVYEQLVAESSHGPEEAYLSILLGYANYLKETKRNAQAQAVLNDYLTNHPGGGSPEQPNILMQLSFLARGAGDRKRADEYQRASMEKQQALQPPRAPQVLITKDLEAAQTAAHAGRFDEALELCQKAIEAAPRAADRDQIVWRVQNIAMELVNKKQADKAERLYQRVLGVVESWSAENPRPFLAALQSYSQFLMQQETRWKEAPAAIKQYRDMAAAMQGNGGELLEEAIQLTMQFESGHGTPAGVIGAAQELLALRESMAGNTSAPYLRGAQELAQMYQTTGDPGRALPILRRNVAIADLVFPPTDLERARIRMTAAMALARQKQFDEAETLATEAVAIGQAQKTPQGYGFATELEQIRQMKNPSKANNPWFTPSKPQLY